MKKIISLLLVVSLFSVFLAGCGKDKTELKVYFRSSTSNELSEEVRNVDADGYQSEVNLAKTAVTQLIKGPQNEKNIPVISPEAKLLSLTVSEGVATVNMSKHYSEKKGVDALLLRFAFINTLCGIDGIDGIVIQVEGKPIVSETSGKEYGVLSISDIAMNTVDNVTLKLYFPDKSGEKLVVERRRVDVQQTLSLEKTVIGELMKGPENENLQPSISLGTKLLNIETKDSVCYVNFSSEFCTKANSGSAATTLTLYSVVNSLCSLENVSSVQILVNGETGVEFGNFVLDIPYEFDKILVD